MNNKQIHTEDIQDIIGNPPNGLLRWGITWILMALLGIVMLASFIRYPDIIRASARINAANAPKPVVSRVAGNLEGIFIEENEEVSAGQVLGFIESTASHEQVLQLLEQLYILRDGLYDVLDIDPINSLTLSHKSLPPIEAPSGVQFGELQGNYQAFYQSYLTYRAATGSGIYLQRRDYILRDIQNVDQQREQLERQRELQERVYAVEETIFKRNEKLAGENVISQAEFEEHQAAILSRQHPIMQTESAILANKASRAAKAKELADLDNQIAEERSKFMQALNSLISETERWKQQYVLVARHAGTVVYAGILQQGQYIDRGQEVFHVNPGSTDFFAEVNVPQYNMGKVKLGQPVLVKLNSFPFEEYGALEGHVGKLSGVPYRDSIFLSRVNLNLIEPQRDVQLTTGMLGTAEIITEDASLLQRLLRNINKVLRDRN